MAPLLKPLDIGDKPVPGRFLLTNIHATDRIFGEAIESYWPSIVLDKSRAPPKVERGLYSPLQRTEEEYLIWVIGKGRFFWANRSHLRNLDEDQLAAVEDTELISLLNIGFQNTAAQNLDMFEDSIMDDTTRIAGGRSILTPALSSIGEPHQAHKRQSADARFGRSVRTRPDFSAARDSFSSAPTPGSMSRSSSRGPSYAGPSRASFVKQEDDDDQLPRQERVQIMVGPINTEFTCSKANVLKSTVLQGYLVQRPGKHAFIMHPDLKEVSPLDFGCVVEYLRTNMYTPALVEAPANRSDSRMFVLEGLTKELEFTDEIQRCGRLHVLAKKLSLPSMVEYVFKRLTQVRYPKAVLKPRVLLQLSKTIFSNDGPNVLQGQAQDQVDALENWLIKYIVENLEMITTWKDNSRLFWEVMHAGGNLSARVFRGRAELDEKFPDLIKIEDD